MGEGTDDARKAWRWAQVGETASWAWGVASPVLKLFVPSWLLAAIAEQADLVRTTLPLALGLTTSFVVLFYVARSLFRDEIRKAHVAVTPVKNWDVRQYDEGLAGQLTAARGAIADLEARNRRLRWEQYYATDPPSVNNADAKQLAQIRHDLSTFETQMDALSKSLGADNNNPDGLISDLTYALRKGAPDDSIRFHFADHFYQRIGKPVASLLWLVRRPGDEDPRQAFIAFYDEYRHFREWPYRIANFTGTPLTEMPHFKLWRSADAALFRELDRLPQTSCADLRRHMENVKKDHDGYPKPLPEPHDSAAHKARIEALANSPLIQALLEQDANKKKDS